MKNAKKGFATIASIVVIIAAVYYLGWPWLLPLIFLGWFILVASDKSLDRKRKLIPLIVLTVLFICTTIFALAYTDKKSSTSAPVTIPPENSLAKQTSVSDVPPPTGSNSAPPLESPATADDTTKNDDLKSKLAALEEQVKQLTLAKAAPQGTTIVATGGTNNDDVVPGEQLDENGMPIPLASARTGHSPSYGYTGPLTGGSAPKVSETPRRKYMSPVPIAIGHGGGGDISLVVLKCGRSSGRSIVVEGYALSKNPVSGFLGFKESGDVVDNAGYKQPLGLIDNVRFSGASGWENLMSPANPINFTLMFHDKSEGNATGLLLRLHVVWRIPQENVDVADTIEIPNVPIS